VQDRFESNITKNTLFNKKDKLLLAFSGGVDSVVLASLLNAGGYSFALAHCNFQLRGKESDSDEKFCRDFAKKLKLEIYCERFETDQYAREYDLSIQMAARELRYTWFKELIGQKKFDFVLTAHHANDNIETVLINLIRGTGIHGLQGIPEKQKHVVRPLLFASKEDIHDYAKKNKIKYRHDSSNDEAKYKRNFLRLNIIPELKKLNPSLENTFANNIKLFRQASEIVSAFSKHKKEEIISGNANNLKIDNKKLLQESSKELLLFEWLSPMGFNSDQVNQLLISIAHNSNGKLFYSSTHKALTDRNYVYIEKLDPTETAREFIIQQPEDFASLPFNIEHEITEDKSLTRDKSIALLDLSKLEFPLKIRRWEEGDRFQPLGMKGSKKLSDFFTNQKLSRFEKEKVWVLCDSKTIVWVVGWRIDERYKISPATTLVLKLKYLN
jgi:tRNA(Ile)-lysidine synthase